MKDKDLIYLERKIAIGMIVSTNFLKQVIDIIDIKWVQSKEAKKIMGWCLDFYKEFKKAPNEDMPDLYMEKLRTTNIQKSTAKLIEMILEDLSEEYERDSFNVDYLMKQAILYAKACKLKGYADQINEQVDGGNILEAEAMAVNFKPVEQLLSNAVTPLGTAEQIKNSYQSLGEPLIKLPGLTGGLGDMVNHTLTREAFVVLLAQNKAGKSFQLMKWAMLAAQQGRNVVFFQAGDMSQAQQERRMGISLSQKSDLKKYCTELYIPTMDCYYNQNGDCSKGNREGGRNADYPFQGTKHKDIMETMKFSDIKTNVLDFPNHKPCYDCKRNGRLKDFKGSLWWNIKPPCKPLGWKETYHLIKKKHKHILNRIKLITYASETLTMNKVNLELDILEKMGFFSDLIVADYLDIFEPDLDTKTMKPNDQENKKWQRARRISQERSALFLSASQSDAQGFDKKFLSKTNFSTDRRKLDHVTAMYGLNMTDEEKRKGIMRFNDIVGRDTEGGHFVHVLHRLQTGQPILGSFY